MTRKGLLFLSSLVILVVIGFWARPVAFINGFLFMRLRLLGGQSRYISADNIRVHYDVVGLAHGPVVLLVHGLGGHAEDWENLSPHLARAGYRVYMIDLPGFGRSEKPGNFSYSVKQQAHVVSAFLDALNLNQVDLGGWSMGGWIVQLVAFEHPERVHKLILFDSGGLREVPSWDTNLFAPSSVAELDQLQALLTPHPADLPGFVSRDIVRLSRQNAGMTHRALESMLTGQDTTDDLLPQLKMSVLIVWDTDDQVFPLGQGRRMNELVPLSQLKTVSGCGHLVVIDCADQIASQVVEFLNSSGR